AAREIPDPGPTAYALLEIAVVQAQAGDRPAAEALVREAIGLVPMVKRSEGLDKKNLTAFAAAQRARMGDLPGALETLQSLGEGACDRGAGVGERYRIGQTPRGRHRRRREQSRGALRDCRSATGLERSRRCKRDISGTAAGGKGRKTAALRFRGNDCAAGEAG